MRKILIVGLAIIFVIAIIVAIYQFFPSIKYQFSVKSNELPGIPDGFTLEEPEDIASGSLHNDNTQNLLLIPEIGVKVPIVEGKDESALDKGAWRMPETSTPDKGSNTVITGHRWKFIPPNEKTFYLLDKLEAGDKFTIYWENKKYEYKVVSISVVLPTDLSVLNPTADSVVTLITCTPLFSTAKRLIVVGELIK